MRKMSSIRSYLISNAVASTGLEFQLKLKYKLPMEARTVYQVFKTYIDKKVVYVGWAGGEFKNGEIHLSLIGHVVLDVLKSLPVGSDNSTFKIQEVVAGPTPTKVKVKKALKRAPGNSKILFVGELRDEPKGEIESLNVKGMIEI